MYESRLGLDRSLESNPMGAMHAVGVALAFGSDSPVTPLDPWGSVRAAVWHHSPAQRMSVRAAFDPLGLCNPGNNTSHTGRLSGNLFSIHLYS